MLQTVKYINHKMLRGLNNLNHTKNVAVVRKMHSKLLYSKSFRRSGKYYCWDSKAARLNQAAAGEACVACVPAAGGLLGGLPSSNYAPAIYGTF